MLMGSSFSMLIPLSFECHLQELPRRDALLFVSYSCHILVTIEKKHDNLLFFFSFHYLCMLK